MERLTAKNEQSVIREDEEAIVASSSRFCCSMFFPSDDLFWEMRLRLFSAHRFIDAKTYRYSGLRTYLRRSISVGVLPKKERRRHSDIEVAAVFLLFISMRRINEDFSLTEVNRSEFHGIFILLIYSVFSSLIIGKLIPNLTLYKKNEAEEKEEED